MPIEIRELVIRAVVEERPAAAPAEPSVARAAGDDEREALIQACVQQVARILRRRRER